MCYTQRSEYWFPRPIKTTNEKPLIILGGARGSASPAFEAYIDDDTTCNPQVGKTLRAFLPAVFEGKFEPGREPEMEWVRTFACAYVHFRTRHDLIVVVVLLFRRASWLIQRSGIHLYVSSSACPRCTRTRCDDSLQVGPVDKLPAAQETDVAQYTGQFIAAGYSGHGMPRAFGW